MQTVVFDGGPGGLRWIDVVGPSRTELLELAETYSLHATSVTDCLDPEHLPKHERIDDVTFIIMRTWDEAAEPEADDLQGITRKLALFYRPDLVLTIHRKDQPILAAVRERFAADTCTDRSLTAVLTEQTLAMLASYDRPLEEMERAMDAFEAEVFDSTHVSPPFRRIHFLKRRVALIKRILWQSMGVLQKTVVSAERAQPYFQDLRETAEGYHFWADQLLEEAQNLLGVHLAMASHRSNEVMRVLTVFAAFFLPLTFIAGVYGMNFAAMPELQWRWGYPLVLALMAGVCVAIFVWFQRRGWIGRPGG
ncbi:MAG: CorA family divalent cation transporter [Gemmatimonadota bacterium]|nr:CorA family divalent cation transporter [Gemmatimonadota bacterium]